MQGGACDTRLETAGCRLLGRGGGTTNLNLGGAETLGLAGGRGTMPSPGGYRASGAMHHGTGGGRQSLQIPTNNRSNYIDGFQGGAPTSGTHFALDRSQ